MTPDQARLLFEFLLPQLESEHAITRMILYSVPPDKGGYKPGYKPLSFAITNAITSPSNFESRSRMM
jgi:hypothetical protein